jgi:hypothetical protein
MFVTVSVKQPQGVAVELRSAVLLVADEPWGRDIA